MTFSDGHDGAIHPSTVREIIARAASSGYDDWWARTRGTGYCAAPIHLTRTSSTGTVRVTVRCKNRRGVVCPSCADLYAGDTWHLVHAGLGGGHGVSETVAAHPAVFVTLTAPGFGAVHTTRTTPTGRPAACHPRQIADCSHGHVSACRLVHQPGDPLLGQPICAECYDYPGHVLFTWHAPQLWARFTTTMRRLVRHRLRDTGTDPAAVRVSFVKVMEMQRRGIPHYHAVIRLDSTTGDAEIVTPPPGAINCVELLSLVHAAAARAHLTIPGPDGDPRTLRFGAQIDARTLHRIEDGTGTRRAVAGYLAKYVTKSVAEHGVSIRPFPASGIDTLPATGHVRALLHALAALAGAVPEYAGMTDWLHTLGYRGHITTKSRTYSTTMGALRAVRADHTRTQGGAEFVDSDDTADWAYARASHANSGERLLAITAAVNHRESRWAARQLADISRPLPRVTPDGRGGEG